MKKQRERKGRQMGGHAVIIWKKVRSGRARLKGVGKIHSSGFPGLDSEPAYKLQATTENI